MKNKSKKIIVGLVALLIVAVLAILYFRYAENKSYEKKGNELIEKIEAYKHQTGKLPNSITDLGITEQMGEGPYYEKTDSLNYIVFFNIGFDNKKTYYSVSKEWKDEP